MALNGLAAVAGSSRFAPLEHPRPRKHHWENWGTRERVAFAIASRRHVGWEVGMSARLGTSSTRVSQPLQAVSKEVPGIGGLRSREVPSLGRPQEGVASVLPEVASRRA